MGSTAVRKAELVKKRSLWGYKGDEWVMFLKLTITDPKSLPKVRDESSFISIFMEVMLTLKGLMITLI